MNYAFIVGKIVNTPEVSILPIDAGKQIYVCKFVVCSDDELPDEDSGDGYNFFECIAFDKAAEKINERFIKGITVSILGRLHNHAFSDSDGTKHFTQIILAEHVEYGDSVSFPSMTGMEISHMEKPVISDLNQMNNMFSDICKNGFLCINEDDYYNLATHNMQF